VTFWEKPYFIKGELLVTCLLFIFPS